MAHDVSKINLILLGDKDVGKTCLMWRFVNGEFKADSVTTVGISFLTKIVEIDNVERKIQFWDTAGQVRILLILLLYLSSSYGHLIKYLCMVVRGYLTFRSDMGV